jgi:hypothetical protein
MMESLRHREMTKEMVVQWWMTVAALRCFPNGPLFWLPAWQNSLDFASASSGPRCARKTALAPTEFLSIANFTETGLLSVIPEPDATMEGCATAIRPRMRGRSIPAWHRWQGRKC